MKSNPLFIVDAFAAAPFTGNPAAVCLLPHPGEVEWMQRVAAEMNLSETAFVSPRADGWDLRWFTPKIEVALCGHATLASAHVLWETGQVARSHPVRFLTQSGWLAVSRLDDRIEMDFPAMPVEAAEPPDGLAKALGATPRFGGRSAFDFLVEVADAARVRRITPDFAALARLPVRGVIVTAVSDDPAFDFISRFFAPAAGVNEDPVTGSAHCSLGPYWRDRLGKADFKAFQASARGGTVDVGVRGDRVLLGGKAVTILRGELA
jgi:PhzF family phenazine biosynthesis protein